MASWENVKRSLTVSLAMYVLYAIKCHGESQLEPLFVRITAALHDRLWLHLCDAVIAMAFQLSRPNAHR